MFFRILAVGLFIALLGAGVYYQKDIVDYYQADQVQQKAAREHGLAYARADYEKAHEKYPDNVAIGVRLAELYTRENNRDKASLLYARLMERFPGNTDVVLGYSEFLGSNPQTVTEAVPVLKKALEDKPDDPRLMLALGHVYKSASESPLEPRKPIKEWLAEWSMYYYRQAVARDPASFQGWFGLGVLYQERQDFEKAAINFCNAANISPNSYEARFNLGLSLIALDHLDAGFRQLAKSSDILFEKKRLGEAHALAERIEAVKTSVYNDSGQSNLHPEKALDFLKYPQCLDNTESAQKSGDSV